LGDALAGDRDRGGGTVNADDQMTFRLARLVLLLAVVAESAPHGVDAERLGVYDFLAGHPLLMARDDDDPDRLALRLAGFDDRGVEYASPAQRFVAGQLRLGRDLTALIRSDLVSATAEGWIRYRLTAEGATLARHFTAMYAHSYAIAARVVVRRLRRMSRRRMRLSLRQWLMVSPDRTAGRLHPAYLIDDEPVPPAPPPGIPAQRAASPKDST
jgi:hypothetical protein